MLRWQCARPRQPDCGNVTLGTRPRQRDLGNETPATRPRQSDLGNATSATRTRQRELGNANSAKRPRQRDLGAMKGSVSAGSLGEIDQAVLAPTSRHQPGSGGRDVAWPQRWSGRARSPAIEPRSAACRINLCGGTDGMVAVVQQDVRKRIADLPRGPQDA